MVMAIMRVLKLVEVTNTDIMKQVCDFHVCMRIEMRYYTCVATIRF